MADYAGAVAAIRARFVDQWKVDGQPRTLIAFQNEPPRDAAGQPINMPPKDADGSPLPFVFLEIIGNGSELRGAGTPGDNIWLYRGGIFAHVVVGEGQGIDQAQQLAVAAGEIFRAATFYENGQGAKVVSMSPQVDGGSSDADNGNLFRVTCFVPFEYFHRG